MVTSKDTLKFAYLNINGAVPKYVLLQDLIKNLNIYVLCLTESHYKTDLDVLSISDFSSRYNKTGKGWEGTLNLMHIIIVLLVYKCMW